MPKKKKNIKKKKISKRKKIISLIILVLILGLVLIFIAKEMGIVNLSLEKIFKKPKVYSIKDSCSLIAGKIIHPIKNEDLCVIKCKDECELNKMEFNKVDFISRESNCNICNCYCK